MVLIDPIKDPLGTIRKQSPSFFRRLARWWTSVGSILIVFASFLAVAHYGYGVPMYDKNTGQVSDPTTVAAILIMLGLGGLFFASLGMLILRGIAVEQPQRQLTTTSSRSDPPGRMGSTEMRPEAIGLESSQAAAAQLLPFLHDRSAPQSRRWRDHLDWLPHTRGRRFNGFSLENSPRKSCQLVRLKICL